MKEITSQKLACIIARFLDDKLAKDISILNIANISVLADYFVICSADTNTQVKGLTDFVRFKVKEEFERIPAGSENDMKNRWNLLDYGDVILHVLHKEERETYAIEKFWNHALRVNEKTWKEESKEYAIYEDVE